MLAGQRGWRVDEGAGDPQQRQEEIISKDKEVKPMLKG
jgi:hypothetical protein